MKKNIYNLIIIIIYQIGFAQQKPNSNFSIENNQIRYNIEIKNGQLQSENISFNDKTIDEKLISDGDFSLEVVWTDWLAPGKHNNGENPVRLSKKDFEFDSFTENRFSNGTKQINVLFKGKSQHLQLLVTYQIEPDHYFAKRKIAIRDTLYSKHFLHKINSLDAVFASSKEIKVIKGGGFGQPVAFEFGDKGFFYGLEYPASTNSIKEIDKNTYQLKCSQYKGENISKDWIESEWVVLGLTPDKFVKKGFMDYINDIKISPNRPYTLYNTWYDLRGEDYPVGSYVKELHDEDYMTEKNILRLYNLIKTNFLDKYNESLDAFVLDDGWDVYASNWMLRKNAFPGGLSPLKNEFQQNGTSLGMWFGPSGGYSARMKRINWYRENGFEVVGEEKQWGGSMLCLAGKKYSQVFKERILDFVNQGVSYFKWDGIQFSCSEVSHGHPIGLYSHAAVLDTLTSIINQVHKINPSVYISITSGTWLSPWWLKYSNQIWMQGEDFGYSEIPSFSQRDASITYRDVVLYDDFKKNNFWFPIGNMMTHGIIKGKLENLHLKEPIDKFTDNAILYIARGVSMYELYTSPDIMDEREWEVIAQSLKWAKNNFDILMNTEMVGGDPEKKEAYGYLHLKETKGVLAARNPYIISQQLEIVLSPEFGLDVNAKNLVLEQVYPYRWISPKLFKTGDKISIPLSGYETAIFEIYPLEKAHEPLLAGVPFESQLDDQGNLIMRYYEAEESPKILNPEIIKTIKCQNEKISKLPIVLKNKSEHKFKSTKKGSQVEIDLELNNLADISTLSFLLKSKNDYTGGLPSIKFTMDGNPIRPQFNGVLVSADFKMPNSESGWYSFDVNSGKHHLTLEFENEWLGNMDVWLSGYELEAYKTIEVRTKESAGQRILPPQINPKGSLKKIRKIGAIKIN